MRPKKRNSSSRRKKANMAKTHAIREKFSSVYKDKTSFKKDSFEEYVSDIYDSNHCFHGILESHFLVNSKIGQAMTKIVPSDKGKLINILDRRQLGPKDSMENPKKVACFDLNLGNFQGKWITRRVTNVIPLEKSMLFENLLIYISIYAKDGQKDVKQMKCLIFVN